MSNNTKNIPEIDFVRLDLQTTPGPDAYPNTREEI
jgi:hypothetical protein